MRLSIVNLLSLVRRLAIIAFLVVSSINVVRAQNICQESEPRELLKTTLDAISAMNNLKTYAVNHVFVGVVTNELVFSDGSKATIVQRTSTTRDLNYSKTGNGWLDWNASGSVNTKFSSTMSPSSINTAYELNADMRFVDKILYVNASQPDNSELKIPLPSGWVKIRTANDIQFYPFQGMEFADFFNDNPLDRHLVENRKFAETVIKEISASNQQLADGRNACIVTLTYDFMTLLKEEPTLLFGDKSGSSNFNLIDNIHDTGLIMYAAFDDDKNIMATDVQSKFNILDVDYAKFSGANTYPAGTKFNQKQQYESQSFISRINDPSIKPVPSPDN